MKSESFALAKKIRAAVTKQESLTTSLAVVNRQRDEVQKAVDAAVATGATDDEKSIAAITSQSARLQLFPTRIKQIETELATQEAVLRDYLRPAHTILDRAATLTDNHLVAEITRLLSPFISDKYLLEQTAHRAVNFCDAHCKAHAANAGFHPQNVELYTSTRDTVLPLANLAVARLETVTVE